MSNFFNQNKAEKCAWAVLYIYISAIIIGQYFADISITPGGDYINIVDWLCFVYDWNKKSFVKALQYQYGRAY